MSNDTKPALRPEELRKLCDAASPGPWFYDSYSRVFSAPLCKLHNEWHAKAIPPGALDDPAFDWEAAAASEPETTVCSVPCRAGDTATEQGARDAEFIEAARTEVPNLIAELERLAAENAALKAKGCPQCGVAAADMVTDNYCAACRVEELKADNGWWAGKCEQFQSALATLRSQLSRIDYAFGEPNEMWCSPYDVDLDGDRVVRQVEAILKGEAKGGG